MTDAEVLNKVILLAEERGFQGRIDTLHYEKPNSTDLSYGKDIKLCQAAIYLNTYQGIVFSHQFAKAFWGEKDNEWQHHLQQMVIKAEPIKYLKQFIT